MINNQFLLQSILFGLFGYVIGSIPFSYLIAKAKKVDLKKVGSKNPGGSNAIANLGFKWGSLGGILDFTKAFLPILIAKQLSLNEFEISALLLGLIFGHCYSFLLNFKGGRGIATTFGGLLVLYPQTLLISFFPVILFILLNQFKISRCKGIVLDPGLGVFLSLLLFIGLSFTQKELSAFYLGNLIFILVEVRRITENLQEYHAKNWGKILILRAVYDRNHYEREPQHIKL